LKTIYEELWKIVDGEASGLTYTNDHGCNIQPHNNHIWKAYTKTHPAVTPFRNKGWPLYDRMNDIVPQKVTGQYV
ncbi:hypothetical protein K435DRAFT_568171, partial [Dendrothele bispora CBS 962.96]